jgi:predicted nuclease with TOPRIM domain
MDVDSIERHYRNTDQSIPDMVQALIDKLQDAELKLEALRDVLDKYDYSDCALLLDEELRDAKIDYENLLDSYKELEATNALLNSN